LLLLLSAKIPTPPDPGKLDNWLKENTGEMGGRAILLVADRNGKILYSHAVNQLNMRQKIAARFMARRAGKDANLDDFTATTRQPIASCSKWLSAALVMRFVDDGTLKLADKVGKFLPVLSLHGKGGITISQCLSHTTAIKAPALKESIEEIRNTGSMEEAIEAIAKLPMEGIPGHVFHYSNAGLQIAAAVIEKISGKDFETLFAERMATPLEMKNTDFGKGKVVLAAGGAFSTPLDYMNFLQMILNKGMFKGRRILTEKSVADMQINRITADTRVAYSPAEAGDAGYGYGEWVMQASTATKLSEVVSSPGLFGSFPWVNNEKGYCAFLMTYYIRPNGRGDRYRELRELVDAFVQ